MNTSTGAVPQEEQSDCLLCVRTVLGCSVVFVDRPVVPPFAASCPSLFRSSTNSSALEKHYRVRELATLWGFSDTTIIRLLESRGVIRLESAAGRRKYTT